MIKTVMLQKSSFFPTYLEHFSTKIKVIVTTIAIPSTDPKKKNKHQPFVTPSVKKEQTSSFPENSFKRKT